MISVDYKFSWMNFWLVLGQPNTLALLHKLFCTRAKLVVATSKVDIVWLCPESMALIASFSLTLMHRESEQLSNTELDNVYGLVILLKCHGHGQECCWIHSQDWLKLNQGSTLAQAEMLNIEI